MIKRLLSKKQRHILKLKKDKENLLDKLIEILITKGIITKKDLE